MPLIYKKFISRDYVMSHPDILFVFGDNIARQGLGGQAKEMRGCPNSVGIPTKKSPSWHDNAFFSDADYNIAVAEIQPAISRLKKHLENGGTVVWPKDGIGTNRADLKNRAPRIWRFLEKTKQGLEQYNDS